MTRVAVIVCTRDRPQSCAATVAALAGQKAEVVVVDQSRDGATRTLLSGGAQLTYLRSRRRGLSAARNEGARSASAPLLLFTDDDCIAAADWVTAWQGLMEADPRFGIGFGPVRAAAYDRGTGHIPAFDPGHQDRGHALGIFLRGASAVGMGANMAVRREAWEKVGGFDEGLGAGSPLPGAEEIDLAYRVVRAGYRLAHSGRPEVVHHGFRPGKEASLLVRGYAQATGAMYVKHLRSGDPLAGILMALDAGRLAATVAWRGVRGRRPLGLVSLAYLLQGAAVARRLPLDTSRRVYAGEPAAPAAAR